MKSLTIKQGWSRTASTELLFVGDRAAANHGHSAPRPLEGSEQEP